MAKRTSKTSITTGLNEARHDQAAAYVQEQTAIQQANALAERERIDARKLPKEMRSDGWVNAVVGFGGAKDKTSATTWDPAFARLTEAQLTGMYATEDLSAKIVNLYPRQALREGWKLTGFKPELGDEVSDFLERYTPETQTLHGLIWGRLYGGAATWFGNDDDPAQPFKMGDRVDFLRTIDRRFLYPVQNPSTLDAQGAPTEYQVRTAQGNVIGTVHASRLVVYPGEMTDDLTRQVLGHWDLSVLQRPFNALRSDGTVWKAAEYLMTEASMGVLKIKNLTSLVAAGQKALLSARLAILNMGRSFAKSMTLDKDTEEYSRETVQFAGIPDLTDRALKRVASAAEIPVSVLIGEAPAGLNATGDNDLRWFLMQVQAYRVHVVHRRALRIVRALLSQPGSPVRESAPKIGIMWPDLWTPSASEMADIFLKYSQGDVNYATAQVTLPEEIALSRFGVSGWSGTTTIRRDLRQEALEGALLPSEQNPDGAVGSDPTQNAPGNAGAAGTNPRGVPGPAPKDGATAPAAGAKPAPGAPAGDVQKEALNGAQVTSLVEIVKSVAVGDLPVEAGVQIIALAYPVTPEQARSVMGGAGTTFTVKKPEPAPLDPKAGPPSDAKKEDGLVKALGRAVSKGKKLRGPVNLTKMNATQLRALAEELEAKALRHEQAGLPRAAQVARNRAAAARTELALFSSGSLEE